MYIGEIIKEYRTTHNISQRAFASRTTLSPSYINTLEKIYNPKTGKPYSVTTDVANEIACAMNMTVEELLSKINRNQEFTTSSSDDLLKKIGAIPLSDIQTVPIPILGTIKAGYDYLAQENIIDYVGFKLKKTDIENYYALNIVGNSMEPLFDEGDTVLVHKQEEFENGDNCVVIINGDEATIKQVYKGNDEIELKAINPYYPPRKFTKKEIKTIPVKIIGVVEKSIRNFKKK